MTQPIELAEAIGQLRSQLVQTIKEGEGEDLRFEVADLELELQVVVTKDAKVGGKLEAGVKFWLFGGGTASAEGGLSQGSNQLQKIKLKLRPKLVSTGEAPDLAAFEEE